MISTCQPVEQHLSAPWSSPISRDKCLLLCSSNYDLQQSLIGPQAKGFWKRKGPSDMGPSDHVPIQWLTRAACSYTLFPVPEHETPVSAPPSCPVEKQVKPFINKGSGAERPSGSVLNLHRRNSIKVPRCYFSSHHLSEIPTRVSCEPHVKSSPEPKRKKE